MPRETRTITTPSGKKVSIKTYITGREANEIKQELYKVMKIDLNGGAPAGQMSGEFLIEQEKKLIATIVTGIEGYEGSNLLEAVLDLPHTDYQAIVAEVNVAYTGGFPPAK